MSQFVPEAFQGYATKATEKQYQKNLNLIAGIPKKDQAELDGLRSYGKVLAKNDPNDTCNGDLECRNAKNQKELDAWYESQTKHMKHFVPAGFQEYVSKGLDEKYGKKKNLIENPPANVHTDIQDVKSLDGEYDKDVKESASGSSSATFLAQRAEEAGSSSSTLTEVKAGVVCFAWAAGAWVLLVLLYGKLRKGAVVPQLSMLARDPEPAMESLAGYTTIES